MATQFFYGGDGAETGHLRGFAHLANQHFEVGIFENNGRVGLDVKDASGKCHSIDITDELRQLADALASAAKRVGRA